MSEINRDDIPKDGSAIKFAVHDGVFLNSKVLFIEFDDVIKSPFFSLLFLCAENESLNQIFDMEDIRGKGINEVYSWYIERDDKNIFRSMGPKEGVIEEKFGGDENKFVELCDKLYYEEFNSDESIITEGGYLNFDMVLRNLLGVRGDNNIVDRILIWNPVYNEFIEKLVKERYGERITFVYGPLAEVFKEHKVTEESTFVFSDIYNVGELIDCDIIQGASIIIADEYYYNYDDEMEPLVDLDKLSDDYFFKFDFFNNIYQVEDHEVIDPGM